jgi:uncharacterized repeat protein (TIGR03803 family)
MKQDSKRATLRVNQLALSLLVVLLGAVGSAWAGERVILTFNGTNGDSPQSNLIADSAGNLYGVTNIGGGVGCSPNPGCGVVFRYSKTSGVWKETILHRFTGGNDGSFPNSIILDSAGNIYGTTVHGGGKGGTCNSGTDCGVVFRLTPAISGSWPEKILYRFSGTDGLQPNALAFDSHGNLYGTTEGGGGESATCQFTAGCGVVFSLTPTASGPWTLTAIHSFIDVAGDGQGALGLAIGAGDVLYVTTFSGGNYTDTGGLDGAIFQFTKGTSGWTDTMIHSFGGTGDGFYPYSAAILDAAGNLYGPTNGGPNYYGYIYELSPVSGGGWTESILYKFGAGIDGNNPRSQLAFDAAGNLYGTTLYGGGTAGKCEYGCGTIFKLTPSSSAPWPESLATRFVDSNGAHPLGALVLNTDGNLYGTASYGGANNDGVLFELTP